MQDGGPPDQEEMPGTTSRSSCEAPHPSEPADDTPALEDAVAAPPYKEGDLIQEGLACYLCGRYTAYKWSHLLEHLRSPKHGLSHKTLHGCFLHTKAREELRSAAQTQYRARMLKQKEDNVTAPTSATEPANVPKYIWREMLCWVRCSSDGMPCCPVECMLRPQIEAPQHAASAYRPPTPEAVLSLPNVDIRKVYMECRAPQPACTGGRTAAWPIAIDVDATFIDAFREWLARRKGLLPNSGRQPEALKDMVRGVARFLHMLEVDGQAVTSAASISDPSILAALYVHGTYKKFFDLSILDPVHTWSRKLLQSLKLFCQFHLELVARQIILTDESKWPKFKVAIEQLRADLCGGLTTRAKAEKEKRNKARVKLDRQRLEAFPKIETLKLAIHRAMLVLQQIKQTSAGRTALSRRELAEATVAIIGILALNGYLGRKKEWQNTTEAHVRQQLSLGLDYLVCSDHKTATIYGDLAKWLAPGTIEAIRCYLSLPKRAGVETFLCPVGDATNEVDIPYALHDTSFVFELIWDT